MTKRPTASLYRVLGLKKTATADEVARAYRRLALKHHPDRGGDRQKFEQIHAAFEVLSDPDRRARYDSTGEFATAPVDNSLAELAQVLAPVLDQLVRQMTAQRDDPGKVDLLKVLKTVLANARNENQGKLSNLNKIKANHLAAAERFESDEPMNLLSELARAQARQIEVQARPLEESVKGIDRVLAYLGTVRYRLDVQQAVINWIDLGGFQKVTRVV